ncbi:WXG100-like domain-containing protein, partial [Streptosporangium soli]|nr:hypothetical protein [Streptosporangium sp. KLBMP 9127]
MGVTLPPDLKAVLDLLGIPWPNIDEDEIRKDAAAWRTVLAGTDPAGAAADSALQVTQQTYKGGSATALAEHWEQTGANGGHLSQAANAAKFAPVVLDGTATVVTATKVAVATWAAVTTVRVSQALLTGGPLGVGAASATMLSARYAMGKILREASEGTGRVIAPALGRRTTEPFERILRNLRSPGGGSPALAGAGAGPGIPFRAGGGGSISDTSRILFAWGTKDNTGKFHGDIPDTTIGTTAAERRRLAKELRDSIKTREEEDA